MAEEKISRKGQNKIVKIVCACIAVLAVVLIICYAVISDHTNKEVDRVAAECNEFLDGVDVDFSQPVDTNQVYANAVELAVISEARFNPDLLVYYNDSDTKLSEIRTRTEQIKNNYKKYYYGINRNIFNGTDVDILSASKGELTAAYNKLTDLSKEVDQIVYSNLWNEDSAWSSLWGQNIDQAKKNYVDFKTKIDMEAAQIKARLDTM